MSIILVTIASSCKKDDTINPPSTTQQTSATTNTAFKGNVTIQNVTEPRTYIVSKPINLSNQSNMTITGQEIAGGSSAAITLTNCSNVTITKCKLYNSTNVGIYLYNCKNITVTENYITNVSTGVNVVQCPLGGIAVKNNQFLNMQGPYPKGQFVQYNNVGGANNIIAGNRCENILGQSNPEDGISIYESNGVVGSPLRVNGNWIRGGGPSTSGGGIMLGDGGGSHLTANANVLVNPGQYGIAISGGRFNTIINNQVYGASQPFTNIGLYVDPISATITNATVQGNNVKYYNAAGVLNGAWLANGLAAPSGWSKNDWNANIDASILPTTLITYN